jgi:uncharacterized protein YecT (DUF1311 family)
MVRISILCAFSMLSLAPAAPAQSPLQHQKAANEALRSQLSKEGKDCAQARDNSEDKACIGEALQQTEKEFGVFYDNLEELLDSASRTNLEQAQQQWLGYRRKSCSAIDEFFREGSARAGMTTRCEIQLTRSRMKDLDALYNLPLHH